jgi:hypothetical protein
MEPLRPMNLGEILDRTFQIYRSRFLVFVGIAALPALAVMAEYIAANQWLLGHPLHGRSLFFELGLSRLIWTALLYVASAFFHLLVRPAFVRTVSCTIANAHCSLRHTLAMTRENWRTMMALNLFEQLVVVLAPASVFIAGVAVAGTAVGSNQSEKSALEGLLLFLCAVSIFLWLATCYSLSFPVAVLEGVPWLLAIKRSWRLSKKSRGRILCTWFAVFAAGYAGSFLLRWTLYFALHFLGNGFGIRHGFSNYLAYYWLPNAVVSTLIGPIYPIALTLFYYDQRIRREGYDIERMMDAAGLNAPTPPLAGVSPIASTSEEESKG